MLASGHGCWEAAYPIVRMLYNQRRAVPPFLSAIRLLILASEPRADRRGPGEAYARGVSASLLGPVRPARDQYPANTPGWLCRPRRRLPFQIQAWPCIRSQVRAVAAENLPSLGSTISPLASIFAIGTEPDRNGSRPRQLSRHRWRHGHGVHAIFGIDDTAILDDEFHMRLQLPAKIDITAMRTAMPKVTCGRMTDCPPSATAGIDFYTPVHRARV